MATLTPRSTRSVGADIQRGLRTIEEVRSRLDLTYKQIAMIVTADESTLHRWRAEESEPSPAHLRTLLSLREFMSELFRTFSSPSDAKDWLVTRNQGFGNRRPLEILLEGKIERLTANIIGFNLGMMT